MNALTDEILPRVGALIQAQILPILGASCVFALVVIVGVTVGVLGPYLLGAVGFLLLAALDFSGDMAALWSILPAALAGAVFMAMIFLLLYPALLGGLYRAYDHALEDREPLHWAAPFKGLKTHLKQTVGTAFLSFVIGTFGFALLVLPGILFFAASTLALPAAALDGLGPLDAMKRAITHSFENPAAHLGLVLGIFIISFGSSLVPLIGTGVGVTLQGLWLVVAYRHWFPAEG